MKRLPTGITKTASGKYKVRIPLAKGADGKWTYFQDTFPTEAIAVAEAERVRAFKATGRVDLIDADLITLAALVAEHMDAESGRMEDNTYRGYLNVWIPHVLGRNGIGRQDIADMPIRSITVKTLENWRDERVAAGAGVESIRKCLILMQAAYKRLMRDVDIRNVPALVTKPSAPPKTEAIVPTTPEEVEKLRSVAKSQEDATFLSVLAYAGMRPGEVRGLKWTDIGQRSIHVQRAVDGTGVKPTKTRKNRTLPISSALKADLDAWKRKRGATTYVFERADGQPWNETDYRNWRKRRFAPAVKDAEIALSRPYDLRHSIASLWIAEGVRENEVAQRLGHSQQMTMDTYSHVVADRDPKDDRTVDQRVLAARKMDIQETYGDVIPGQVAVQRRKRKARKRSVSAVAA